MHISLSYVLDAIIARDVIFYRMVVFIPRNECCRMGPNALAIVFAPCILRTQKIQQAQDSLTDIARQTAVLDAILTDKMKTVNMHTCYNLFDLFRTLPL